MGARWFSDFISATTACEHWTRCGMPGKQRDLGFSTLSGYLRPCENCPSQHYRLTGTDWKYILLMWCAWRLRWLSSEDKWDFNDWSLIEWSRGEKVWKTNRELGQSPGVQYTFTESHSRLLVVGVTQWPAFTLSGNVLVGCTMNNCWTGNSGSDYAQSLPTENTNVKILMKKIELLNWVEKSGKRPDSTILKGVWLNKEVFNKVYKLAGDWWKLSVREGWVN